MAPPQRTGLTARAGAFLLPAVLDEIGHPKKRAFLKAFAETGNITDACKASKIPRSTYYVWTEQDDTFVAACGLAKQTAIENLESEARRRAVTGVPKPIYSRDGKLIDTVWDYSDTLLIFLLKGAAPDKYKDRIAHEHKLDEAVQAAVRQLAAQYGLDEAALLAKAHEFAGKP